MLDPSPEPQEHSMSLSNIVFEAQKVVDSIIRSGGELSPEIELIYTELATKFVYKVDACSYVLRKLESEVEFFKKQAQFYQKLARAIDNSRERIRDGIKAGMLTLEKTEVLGSSHRFVLTKAPEKLIIDENKLSPEYMTVVHSFVPDRERILAELKAGKIIEGAELVEIYALRDYANRKGT
jgi:hypothetical protein